MRNRKEEIVPMNLFDKMGTSAQMETARRIGARSVFGRTLFVCYVREATDTRELLNDILIHEAAVRELLKCKDEDSLEREIAEIYADLCLLLAFVSENQSTDMRVKTFAEKDIDDFMDHVLTELESKADRKIAGENIEKINGLIRASFFDRIKFEKPKNDQSL